MTGLSAQVIADLVAGVGPVWQARGDARCAARPRLRAGARYRLVFLDRLLATLVHLRHGVPHDVPAVWLGVGWSTVTQAVDEIRPILAERGCRGGDYPAAADLGRGVDHLGATGSDAIMWCHRGTGASSRGEHR
ncbi:transposase family protein [Actinokineospora sp. NBRC 105648]|uniref:helix-turn-helix domain-containing protein n=1 Tax=Actinokineospora sp. NBRC 105648 TaxID=3032206 RepID=UPI00249F9646|nr:transposase family protein [Actinokineospora sp. NBRC 105648]GLZ42102.1 hypothetical protein Acsp05_57260 [Actinokineospora sp. NBRC 105648]